MVSLNTIIQELKNVPPNRLDDLYAIIHSLQVPVRQAAQRREKILSFAGIFRDLSEADFHDLQRQTAEARASLFNRDFEL